MRWLKKYLDERRNLGGVEQQIGQHTAGLVGSGQRIPGATRAAWARVNRAALLGMPLGSYRLFTKRVSGNWLRAPSPGEAAHLLRFVNWPLPLLSSVVTALSSVKSTRSGLPSPFKYGGLRPTYMQHTLLLNQSLHDGLRQPKHLVFLKLQLAA